MKHKKNSQIGASAIEYGLVLAVILTMVIAGAKLMGQPLTDMFQKAAGCVLSLANGSDGCTGHETALTNNAQNSQSSNNTGNQGANNATNTPAYMSDPDVVAEMKKAWKESNPNAPSVQYGKCCSKKKEQGGWIYKDSKGNYRVERWPAGTRDGVTPNQPNPNKDEILVGEFHTHPNTKKEGYDPLPSSSDINAKDPNIDATVIYSGGYHHY